MIYGVWGPQYSTFTWGVLAVAVLMMWVCFAVPTHCDYMTRLPKPCDRRVRGRLRGCHDHGRWERDALWATFRLRNPGLIFRLVWSAPGDGSTRARSVPAEAVAAPSQRSAYSVAMLSLAIVSALAAVLALCE